MWLLITYFECEFKYVYGHLNENLDHVTISATLTIVLSLGAQQQDSKERSKYKIVAREKNESKESKESKVPQKSKMLRS